MKDSPISRLFPSSGSTYEASSPSFLWGIVFGVIAGFGVGLWALQNRWKKAKEEGRSEERLSLESEISSQRQEAELKRREADARRWEIEDAQSEIQRLQWELRRAKEIQEKTVAEKESKIRDLEAELARARGYRE